MSDMKTAEEIADKHLSEAMKGSMGSPMNSFYNGFLEGYNEGQSNFKIKQLEWEDNENCLTKGITARTSFCTYQTMELSNGNSSLFTDNRIICQDFPIDYIKQYAQEDFEARIKECLITE